MNDTEHLIHCRECACVRVVHLGNRFVYRCPMSTVDVEPDGYCSRGVKRNNETPVDGSGDQGANKIRDTENVTRCHMCEKWQNFAMRKDGEAKPEDMGLCCEYRAVKEAMGYCDKGKEKE